MSTAITTIQVAASTDDARNWGYDWPGDGNYSATGTFTYIGNVTDAWYLSALRFLSVPVPQGATIESAKITLCAHADETSSVNFRIAGEDVDDAATFGSGHQPYAVYGAKTTANVVWTPGNWTAGSWYESPDIKTIIQELVDRAGWASGADMAFVLYASSNAETAYRRFRTYDYTGNASGAKLDITYTAASSDINVTATTASAAAAGVGASVASAPIAVTAATASATAAGVDASAAIEGVDITVTAGTAAATAEGVAPTVAMAGIAVTAGTAAAVAAGVGASVTAAPLTVTAGTASATAAGVGVTVAAETFQGLLHIAAEAGESVIYSLALADLDAAEGTLLQTSLRVNSDTCGTGQGLCFSLFDGVYQFALWLRSDGLNLDGEANVVVDLTLLHTFTLRTIGAVCEVYVDGELLQTGGPCGITTDKGATFGTTKALTL